MNTFRQHIPSFIDGEPEVFTFNSWDELRAKPPLDNWVKIKTFHKFSVDGGVLLVELRGGREWHVVGYFSDPIPELQTWNQGIYECMDECGNYVEIPGELVASSCGDDIFLRDGRKLKRPLTIPPLGAMVQ